MKFGNAWRIVLIVCLLVLAQLQLTVGQKSKLSSAEKFAQTQFTSYLSPPHTFDLPFPIINKPESGKNVEWANKFLKIPTWSAGHIPCGSNDSEVSCFEVVRAANTIKLYEKLVEERSTEGQVYVDIANQTLPDKMTMLYHAVLIAITTNRAVIVDKTKFPMNLPSSITQSNNRPVGIEMPTDYQFGCAPIGHQTPNLLINNVTWPQALYTHHIIAPFLRETFSYHAAYFVGNYLFGTSERPSQQCTVEAQSETVEGWNFPSDYNDMINVADYSYFLPRCGTKLPMDLMTNIEIDHGKDKYRSVYKYELSDQGFLCALQRLISGQRVVFTFGSRLGFWAAAMLGAKSGYINPLDRICVNLTNSQCGSLWHTYLPAERTAIFRTNNRMFVCGPNIVDARLYIDYLLW